MSVIRGWSQANSENNSVARYIIDPSGTVWDVDQLVTHHEASLAPIVTSDQALLEALVMDRGYAGLRISDRGCQVFINPSKMLRATLSALQSMVTEQSSNLIVSGCYREQWRYQIHVSKTDILDHITMLMEQEQRPDCLLSRELSPVSLSQSNTPQLGQVMELIRHAGGRMDMKLLTEISRLTQQRFLVCRWDHEGHLWRVEQSGSGYGEGHIDLSRHQVLGTQPAYRYGCWVHDRYLEVKAKAVPVVEDVDADVFTPGVGQRRMKYRRILAPMVDKNGSAVLLSTSVRDQTINLASIAR
ncbi:MAG: hypothetical protein JXQ99_29760 [Hyphomicrobiaceae bacterium]